MKLQQLYSLTRQAIDEYQLIQEGDRIAIGISGGKDSLTLLYALAGLRHFYPRHFEIEAITVDLGIETMDFTPIEKLCRTLDVKYSIIPTEINKIVFEIRKETNPCSLCAKLRKGALNNAALKLNCNLIAYAHHRDDIIETLFMSLFFEGRINTFKPKTFLDQTKLSVIRPMIFLTESDIIGFQNRYQLPVVKNRCPADGFTRREEMKNLLKKLNKQYPGVKDRIFTSVKNYLYSEEQ